MQTLTDMVDSELEAAGFHKEAYNPFLNKDRDQRTNKPENDPSTADEVLSGLPPTPEQSARTRGDTSPAMRNPALFKEATARLARELPMKDILKGVIEKQASQELGLRSRNEVYQTFTGSDLINHIKLASVREMLLKYLPDEMMLPLVQKFKGTSMFPTQYADELEALLSGRMLRSAGQAHDVDAARKLFEGFGGSPTIDPSDLAGLTMKAREFDQIMQAAKQVPSIGPGTAAAMGLGAGALGTHLLNRGASGE